MADLLTRIRRGFERTFPSAHMVAGACDSYTLEQVGDLLEHAGSISGRAKNTAAFVKYSDVLGKGGDNLYEAADKVNGLVKKGHTAALDVRSACEISDAVETLDRWVLPNSQVSNQEAAQAFDRLFGGAANFFEKLPPPVNAYAQVLSSIAEFRFFSHMQDLMDPESPNTPKGRQLREIMRDL